MSDETNESLKAVDAEEQSTANENKNDNSDTQTDNTATTETGDEVDEFVAPLEGVDRGEPLADEPEVAREGWWRRWRRKGHPVVVIIIAVAILLVLSLVPWGDKTGNFLKDFNLLSDIFPTANDSTVEATDILDPALEAELKGLNAGPVAPALGDSIPMLSGENGELADNPALDTLQIRNVPDKPKTVDGIVVLEDYTYDGVGLKNLRKALANRSSRPARITMIGDSYIEGDIITSDLRQMLQKRYGGRGVGYVAAHNIVQGFRTSLRHNDSGWKQHPMNEIAGTHYMTLAGDYYTGNAGATITLKGVDKDPTLAAWNTTRVLFIAPNDGKITLTADGKSHTFDIKGAPGVQSVMLPCETTSINVKSDVNDLKLLGVWLEDSNGVVVDNMSMRGDSGISRKYVNVSLSQQMRKDIDYDLIIVEYGINALSSKQTDYSKYGNIMVEVLQRLRQCYPNADIILMGIGDRGQKIHGEPHSLPTAANMVAAQRQAAKTAGVIFWDTREAMGGEDAIVRWRDEKYANGDFIHLNHQGGQRLAEALYNAIEASLK